LTWKYGLSSIALTYVLYCFLTNQPFFSSKLPRYEGPYNVGAIDIEVPVREPRLIHDAVFKGSGEPAFKLDTVLFTLYYPAKHGAKSKKAHHNWVPKPLWLTAVGYAKFARISNFFTDTLFTSVMGILVGGTKIPAEVDIPLIPIPELSQTTLSSRATINGQDPIINEPDEGIDPSTGLPIIIFSHGMASSRTQYSHYLSELASRGYICAAIEHRDGSGPGTQIITSPNTKPINRLHFNRNDVQQNPHSATPNHAITPEEFKRTQLAYREAEILETTHIIHSLNNNPDAATNLATSNSRHEGTGAGLSSGTWTSRLNTSLTILAGHSYGATGALQALKTPSSSSSSKNQPPLFAAGILLDPGKSSGPLNNAISVPILIIHSQSWSASPSTFSPTGRPHFDTVRDIATSLNSRGVPAWFLTSMGTSHASVTDAPIIEPGLMKRVTGASVGGLEGVRGYIGVSEEFGAFLRGKGKGKGKGVLGLGVTGEEFKVGDPGVVVEGRGRWQVHVCPGGKGKGGKGGME